MKRTGMMYHSYADDTQIYLAFEPGQCKDEASARSKVESALSVVKSWMTLNMLKLNQDKTEVMVISTKGNLIKNNLSCISFEDVSLQISSQAKDLGVTFDSNLAMESHVSAVCRSAYMHLHNIGRVRNCLDQKTAKTLVHALITSRLDYCNSVLYGVSEKLLHRLQLIQNSAARIVTKSRKRTHITPILKQLHWLPVTYRIQYKALFTVFKILDGTAPGYLSELILQYKPKRSLRSENQLLLEVPCTRLKTFGDRAFSVFGPKLLNNLPMHVKQAGTLEHFKTVLKTHLFTECYGCTTDC